MAKFKKARRDMHQEVTNTIIAALEKGAKPWVKSWRTNGFKFADGSTNTGRPLRHNGTPYRGINVVILWATMYSNPYWMTFNQAAEYAGLKKDAKGKWIWEEGKGVKKGEKSTGVVFYKPIKIKDKETGDPKKIWFMKPYNVFNAEQIENLPEKFYGAPAEPVVEEAPERVAELEAFMAATGAKISHGGGRAFYRPGTDEIVLPEFEDFDGVDAYYATAFHEMGHWTGNEKRLDRKILNGFGTKDYAKEELVAELCAAYTCATEGVNDTPREDHAEYLAVWLKRLEDDKKFIFEAASAAQKAADYLAASSTETEREEAA